MNARYAKNKRYAQPMMVMHAVGVLGLMMMLILGFGVPWLHDHAWRSAGSVWHKQIGLWMLGVGWVRVWVRFIHEQPDRPRIPANVWYSHQWVHGLLYVLLILIPISGWVMSSAAGKMPLCLGWHVALPVPQTMAWVQGAKSVHNGSIWALLGILCLHVGGMGWDRWRYGVNRLPRMLSF